jgi:hypothetical protein
MKKFIILALAAGLAYCAAPKAQSPVAPPGAAPPPSSSGIPPVAPTAATPTPTPIPNSQPGSGSASPPPTRPPVIPVESPVAPPIASHDPAPPPVVIPPVPELPPPATTGNCINARCGNLGTKIYIADVLPVSVPPSGYQPQAVLFFPTGDQKDGIVTDKTLIALNRVGHYPAGYTTDSFYRLAKTPTPRAGILETCAGSGGDYGICLHRFAGILEWDAWKIYVTGGKWNFDAAIAHFAPFMGGPVKAEALIIARTNTFLAKYGKYIKPPCLKLPCP